MFSSFLIFSPGPSQSEKTVLKFVRKEIKSARVRVAKKNSVSGGVGRDSAKRGRDRRRRGRKKNPKIF